MASTGENQSSPEHSTDLEETGFMPLAEMFILLSYTGVVGGITENIDIPQCVMYTYTLIKKGSKRVHRLSP